MKAFITIKCIYFWIIFDIDCKESNAELNTELTINKK